MTIWNNQNYTGSPEGDYNDIQEDPYTFYNPDGSSWQDAPLGTSTPLLTLLGLPKLAYNVAKNTIWNNPVSKAKALRRSAERGNPEAVKEMAKRSQEAYIGYTSKKGINGRDFLSLYKKGYKRSPNGNMYDPAKWKWDTAKGLIRKDGLPPAKPVKNIEDYFVK